MATGSWTLEVESPVEASRLFKAAVLDWHSLAPKIVPEIIAGGAVTEGEGGVGAIRQINFAPNTPRSPMSIKIQQTKKTCVLRARVPVPAAKPLPHGYVKERLDFLDMDALECKQTLVEGGHIGSKLETATSHFKFEAAAGGGSVCRVATSYKLLPGVEDDHGETIKGKEAVAGMIKAAEGYLLANPEAYV